MFCGTIYCYNTEIVSCLKGTTSGTNTNDVIGPDQTAGNQFVAEFCATTNSRYEIVDDDTGLETNWDLIETNFGVLDYDYLPIDIPKSKHDQHFVKLVEEEPDR